MLVTVDHSVEFNRDFRNGDQFIRYIYTEGPAELTAGRQFALETMLLAGALFIAGQAIAAYYRKTAADAAKQRHEEVLAKLDELTRNPNAQAIQDTLALTNYTVQIQVDPTEHALLAQALRDMENRLPNVKIVRLPAASPPPTPTTSDTPAPPSN